MSRAAYVESELRAVLSTTELKVPMRFAPTPLRRYGHDAMQKIAVVAYEGFNELDVFANLHVLNRVARVWPGAHVQVQLEGNAPQLRSMYGVQWLARNRSNSCAKPRSWCSPVAACKPLCKTRSSWRSGRARGTRNRVRR
jgi:hypothetical protein